MILRTGTYADLRIELTVDERSRPCGQLIDEMKQFLAEQLGDKAATFEHVSVSDPGFAHFRKVKPMNEKKPEHQPQHPDGPTWCVKCGTFDVYFVGTQCREASKDQAFWRREPEQK